MHNIKGIQKLYVYLFMITFLILSWNYIGNSKGPWGLILICRIVFYGTLLILVLKRFGYDIGFPKEKQVSQPRNTDHGSARWATEEEFRSIGNDAINGLWIGNGYLRSNNGHLLTVASSGQGKGTCIILPNLLKDPFGSYVITDPKGENAFISARNQQESGQQVYILDPWNEQQKLGAKHGIPVSCFNPFDFIKSDLSELRDNCELIANYLVPEKPHSKDPYWDDRARALLKTMLMHIVTDMPTEKHNFWTLYKMVRISGDEWMGLLADMKLNENCDELISIAAEEFIGMDQNGPTIAGIRSNAQNATSIFESPQLRTSLSKSDFNPYDLTNGNCTVYIVIPERFLQTHGAWLRLVIGICLKACNSRPNKRVNFLVDEAGVMGKMKDIENAYAFARGQNIVLWTFFQSLSQVKEIYGENGMHSLLGNTTLFQAFGIRDQFTKEYVSKALGDATYIKSTHSSGTSTSNNANGGSGSSSSVSYSSFGRPLLTPDEVEKFPDIIIISQGLKFSLFKIAYFENRFDGFNKKNMPAWVSTSDAKKINSGELPIDCRESFQHRADPPPRILV